jgi:Family of unknown function (DUF6084)
VPTTTEAAPQLAFEVEGATALAYAAVPTLRFDLRIDAARGEAIRSVALDVQVQIAARRRPYGEAAQDRLLELFGTPDRWRTTLRTLPWLRTSLVVPPFEATTVVALDVPCTYDFEVTSARYLAALDEDDVPLELLFSGTVFYAGRDGRLQTGRISWEAEAEYGLPVRVWREAMDRHFPGAAWLRVSRDRFDRLAAYKARRGLATWDDAVDALLEEEG